MDLRVWPERSYELGFGHPFISLSGNYLGIYTLPDVGSCMAGPDFSGIFLGKDDQK